MVATGEEVLQSLIWAAAAWSPVCIDVVLCPVVTNWEPPIHHIAGANDAIDWVMRSHIANGIPFYEVEGINVNYNVKPSNDVVDHWWRSVGKFYVGLEVSSNPVPAELEHCTIAGEWFKPA